MTGQDVLGEDKQPNFGDRAVQAATVKLTNIAVAFGITKSSFNHLSPDLVPDFDRRILHLFSMSIQNLLAFELLQRAAFVWVTHAARCVLTTAAMFRRTMETMLDDKLVVAPSFARVPQVIQRMHSRTNVRLQLRTPGKLLAIVGGGALLRSFLLRERILLDRRQQFLGPARESPAVSVWV